MEERERGPIEKELHEMIRQKNLGAPWLLDAGLEGRDTMSTDEVSKQALYGNLVLMEALLRLAREVDDLRAGN